MSIIFALGAVALIAVLLISAIYTAEEISWDVKSPAWTRGFFAPDEVSLPTGGMTMGEKLSWLAQQVKERKEGVPETHEEVVLRLRREHKEKILRRVAERKETETEEEKLLREVWVDSLAQMARDKAADEAVFAGLSSPRPRVGVVLRAKLAAAGLADRARAAWSFCNSYCL